MLIPASTRVSISRAVQTDAYGDPVDIDSVPLYTGVPCTIALNSRATQNPASTTPRQVSWFSCVVPHGTDIRDDDRIVDEATGVVYDVEGVNPLPSFGVRGDVWCTLTRSGG